MNRKKLLAVRIILIALTLSVMTVIFLLSADDADESNQKSDFLADSFFYTFLADFDLTDEEIEVILGKCVMIIRNTAHFAEYGALGFLCASVGISFHIKPKINIPVSFAFSALYAVSDEIHQYFVPGRSCQITDIFIDSAGAFCGAVMIVLIVWLYNRQIAKSNNKKKKVII